MEEKCEAWKEGFQQAELEFYSEDLPEYVNPFPVTSPQWEGYEEGVYTFTQK